MPARTYPPVTERMLARRLVTDGGCWLYTGFITDQGYGRIGYQGRSSVPVHAVAYQEWVGPIPAGTEPDHLCHTRDTTCPGGPTCQHRRCFNPEHLQPTDHHDNVLRGRAPAARNAAKTHCSRGHEFTPENTYRCPSKPNARTCRTCLDERNTTLREQRKATTR